MNRICLCCGKPLSGVDVSGWHKDCVKDFFGTYEFPDFSFLSLDPMESALLDLEDGPLFPGVQAKFSPIGAKLRRLSRKTVFDPKGYIVKSGEGAYPFLPEYEQLTMLMAGHVGIETVPHALIEIGAKRFYISKRIDREGEKKFPMEDFCQLCEKETYQKYDSSYEYCFKKALSYSSQRKIDALKFFSLVLFSYLVGNTDMHLKNFSLLDRGYGYRLAPAYDLLPSELIAGQKEMALSLNGKRTKLTRRDFLAFAKCLEIPEAIASKLIFKMAEYATGVEADIENSLLPSNLKEQYVSLILGKIRNFRSSL